MIPKKNRISKEFFEEISKKGKNINSSLFSIKYLKNSLKNSLFSVVVSKKVSKTAVERNLIKRRYKYIINKHKNLIKQGYFIVFYIKKESKNENFSNIQEEFLKTLEKSGLLI